MNPLAPKLPTLSTNAGLLPACIGVICERQGLGPGGKPHKIWKVKEEGSIRQRHTPASTIDAATAAVLARRNLDAAADGLNFRGAAWHFTAARGAQAFCLRQALPPQSIATGSTKLISASSNMCG